MFYVGDPTGFLVIGAILAVVAVWQIVVWVRAAPVQPDPWDAETADGLEQSEATPICHRCLSPQEPGGWFCKRCGAAIGPYNNFMPYLNVFSEGEVFRNGLRQRTRNKPLVILGYLLISLSTYPAVGPLCLIFAGSYLISLVRNLGNEERQRTPPAETPAPNSGAN